MLEFIGTYFFISLWGLSITIVILIAYVIFIKRDVSTQLTSLQEKTNCIITKEDLNKINTLLDAIKESQGVRDLTLDKLIKQHEAFVKFLKNVAQNDGKIDIVCFEENDIHIENESECKLLLDYRKEKRRSSLFDIYDKK